MHGAVKADSSQSGCTDNGGDDHKSMTLAECLGHAKRYDPGVNYAEVLASLLEQLREKVVDEAIDAA